MILLAGNSGFRVVSRVYLLRLLEGVLVRIFFATGSRGGTLNLAGTGTEKFVHAKDSPYS
jgi:hypothetical protein